MADTTNQQTGGWSLLARLFWFGAGPAGLLFSAVFILKSKDPGLSVVDAVYAAFAVGLVVVRYVDTPFLRGWDSEGRPSTIAIWKRYAVQVTGVAMGIWVLAHGATFLLR